MFINFESLIGMKLFKFRIYLYFVRVIVYVYVYVYVKFIFSIFRPFVNLGKISLNLSLVIPF